MPAPRTTPSSMPTTAYVDIGSALVAAYHAAHRLQRVIVVYQLGRDGLYELHTEASRLRGVRLVALVSTFHDAAPRGPVLMKGTPAR